MLAALREAAANALIEALARTVAPRRCLVPQPAFSEYGRALAAQGCETLPFLLTQSPAFALDADGLIDALIRERPVALLIDEAFVDYVPAESIVAEVLEAGDDVLVLRSLTKFYAMPGMRVGYALGSARFAQAVATRVPSWPVTSLAAVADCLAQNIAAVGARALPSVANFLLIETPFPSTALTELLAQHYPTLEAARFVRVGVRSEPDNTRLTQALAQELRRCG